MDPTTEALARITSAARQWSAHPGLTRGQRAMARTLERQSAELAAAPLRSVDDMDSIKLICCHLYELIHGAKPEPNECPLGLCAIPDRQHGSI